MYAKIRYYEVLILCAYTCLKIIYFFFYHVFGPTGTVALCVKTFPYTERKIVAKHQSKYATKTKQKQKLIPKFINKNETNFIFIIGRCDSFASERRSSGKAGSRKSGRRSGSL